MKRPRILTGALVGLLLTAPLLAILYLARHLLGLPFVPFDVFDWTARVLPGALITFGIDTMVALIGALGLGISDAAKTSERLMAVSGLLVTGMVAGAVLFRVQRRPGAGSGIGAGLIAGVVIGLPAMLISVSRSGAGAAGTALGAIWVIALFLAWGAALGWAYGRLRPRAPAGVDTAGAAAGDDAGTADAGGPAARAADGAARLEALGRRRFLVRLGGASAVLTVAGAGLGSILSMRRELAAMRAGGEPWSADNALPNAGADVEPAPGTRPELTPLDDHYRIDINTQSPVVEEADWRLSVGGLVANPLELTLAELRGRYPAMHQFVTLACISNPIAGDLMSTTRWTGAGLRAVLDDAGLDASATHLRVRAVDGFHETVDLDVVRADPRVMLAYAWDGLPLRTEHGFPLRIYIPDRYGMKQPKWIESIEAVPEFEPGYWVQRGWDREARMRATSVIDVVASNMMLIEAEDGEERMTVPIGGIAHAGARGISRVEVRVDDGPWRRARLRAPLSGLTWVLWRYDWPFEPGDHRFTVRCVDGAGTSQVEERSPVRPDGATGLHSEQAML